MKVEFRHRNNYMVKYRDTYEGKDLNDCMKQLCKDYPKHRLLGYKIIEE